MSKRKRHRVQADVTVSTACQLLETVLGGGVRGEILDAIQTAGDPERSLARLRGAMRAHVLPTHGTPIALGRVVQALDTTTRGEGFHVLQSWDSRAQRFADDIVPVLLLDRCADAAAHRECRSAALALLLDQYFLSLLGLLAVRAWDDDAPDAVLDRITGLLRSLHETDGGGSQFVDDAETLLLLAVSHYHPRESAYTSLLDRVRCLDDAHRLRFALACAPVLGSHLRWGLRFMYRRDLGALRDDNVVDYPWLLFSLLTLARADAGARRDDSAAATRASLAEGLLSGLSADPWAFTGHAPRCLGACEREHAEVREFLWDRRADLVSEFGAHRPAAATYSPLGLAFNFLCNALVAMAATAITDGQPHPSLNALLSARGHAASAHDAADGYAKRLMAYARADNCGDTRALIVYDPCDAQHAFNTTVQVLTAGQARPAISSSSAARS